AYGGARGLFHSIFVDFVRILLLPYVFVYEAIKIGPVSSLYKIIWKIIFTIGYYYQMFFKFLGKYE
ncbi:MAG: hypothetical protein PHX27_03795, partial [Candidatus ainarchaeum sp.]|nr:hypothetical protein [Candidatus ainarchaeum sp.]